MYVPAAFREDRPDILRAAMRTAHLPILVTTGADGMIASHVPLLLNEHDGPHGTLLGHLARANPQARTAGQALAIFAGPDSYVTPSWYPSKQLDGKVVPTWNYIAVHASGPISFFDDADRLRDIVTRLTAREEAKRAKPWAVGDAPADYIAGMLRAIIGFCIPITRLEGKWKLSQNRLPADRAGVAAGLAAEGQSEIAGLIAP